MRPVIDLEREYGLVLEGGGARGAYQIGVWKALREAGVKIRGISGTSVGALNGAMICMDDLERAEETWENISYSQVLRIDETVFHQLKHISPGSLDFAQLASEMKKIVVGRGLDISPLRAMLREMADEERIRASERELYATAFCVTDMKEVNFDVKEVPQGMIPEILLASSCLPGFKSEKIGGKLYMDGGSVNNVPLNVLTERGYTDIIIVRIFGIGVDREKLFHIPEGVRLYRVEPRRNLGGILEFDSRKTRRNLLLGYYDGMRFLYGLEGRRYYIYLPGSEAYYFDKMMSELEVLKCYLEPFVSTEEQGKLSGYRAYTEQIFPHLAKKMKLDHHWDYRDLYAAILEVCARKMGLEVFRIYTADEIMGSVLKILGESRMGTRTL